MGNDAFPSNLALVNSLTIDAASKVHGEPRRAINSSYDGELGSFVTSRLISINCFRE